MRGASLLRLTRRKKIIPATSTSNQTIEARKSQVVRFLVDRYPLVLRKRFNGGPFLSH
jgi:hypothetical protein